MMVREEIINEILSIFLGMANIDLRRVLIYAKALQKSNEKGCCK